MLGIDPAEKIAEQATQRGIPTIAEFFNAETAKRLVSEYGQANVVICNNTLANIDDLCGVLDGIRTMLAPEGLLVIENAIRDGHGRKHPARRHLSRAFSYFAVRPMQAFLAAQGFELVNAERIAPKGGSIRFYAQLKGAGRAISARVNDMIAAEHSRGLYGSVLFERFNERVAKLGAEIRNRLAASKKVTGRALAFGQFGGLCRVGAILRSRRPSRCGFRRHAADEFYSDADPKSSGSARLTACQ